MVTWRLERDLGDEEDPILTVTDEGWDDAPTVRLNEDVEAVRALLADAEVQHERASDRLLPLVAAIVERKKT